MNLDLRKLIEQHTQNRAQRGLEVLNQDGADDEPAEIRIYDVIGWPWLEAKDVVDELDKITAPELIVAINSPGGDVFDSIAIYNALRQHPAHVTTRVDSLAASGASIIVQAGDHRIMVKASQTMIHNAWMLAAGDAAWLRETADILEQQDEIIAGIYAERAGKTESHFRPLMSAETWMNDVETVDEGLADEVVNPPRKAKPSEDPEAKTRFSEHAQSVLTDVEQLIDRAEKVVTFRTGQGKPPLSEDSVETLERLAARLNDVLTSEETPPPVDELEVEYLRFVSTTQGV